jgi:hypothetical protein
MCFIASRKGEADGIADPSKAGWLQKGVGGTRLYLVLGRQKYAMVPIAGSSDL